MTSHLTFLLNGELETIPDCAPTVTLLQYLRNTKQLTGTKEGCAEGDCGACTVVVGELVDGKIAYRAVNACILFLPMLHGKSVRTVEGLAAPDGTLHRCQQAIVDRNGSQCGFCTPGFAASMYALAQSGASGTLDDINDGLAGNLCRCTGYGPLIDAARDTLTAAPAEWEAGRAEEEQRALATIELASIGPIGQPAAAASGEIAYCPTSADEFADLYDRHPDALVVAGATDVGLWVTKKLQRLGTMIHIGGVSDLRYVKRTDQSLRIGAAATYADVHEEIASAFPDFGELIRRLGATQVRNTATLCGNVANGSPIGDTSPALIALGAEIVLRKGTTRRRLAVEDFFIAYGKQDRAPSEFIEEIEIPLLDNPEQLRCYKISKRFDQDISALCGCFNVVVEGGQVTEARLAYGGMAATPKRAKGAEAALVGAQWGIEAIANAVAALEHDFTPISDMRASGAYRLSVAGNLLRKYFHERESTSTKTRLVGRGARVA